MRNLVIGIAVGIALALAAGAVAPSRYQIAVTDSGNIVFRLDTQTGAVETSFPGTPQREMLQFIQPR